MSTMTQSRKLLTALAAVIGIGAIGTGAYILYKGGDVGEVAQIVNVFKREKYLDEYIDKFVFDYAPVTATYTPPEPLDDLFELTFGSLEKSENIETGYARLYIKELELGEAVSVNLKGLDLEFIARYDYKGNEMDMYVRFSMENIDEFLQLAGFNFNQLRAHPLLAQYVDSLEDLVYGRKWGHLDFAEMARLAGMQGDLTQFIEEYGRSTEEVREEQKRILEIIASGFRVKEKTFDGEKGFEITPDKERLIQALEQLKQEDPKLLRDLGIRDGDIDEFIEDLEDVDLEKVKIKLTYEERDDKYFVKKLWAYIDVSDRLDEVDELREDIKKDIDHPLVDEYFDRVKETKRFELGMLEYSYDAAVDVKVPDQNETVNLLELIGVFMAVMQQSGMN